MRNHIALVLILSLPGICLALSAVAANEAQSTRKDRDWPARAIPDKHLRGMLRADVDEVKEIEATYRNALDSNRERAGAVADSEIDRLHRLYTERLLSITSRQVTLLQ